MDTTRAIIAVIHKNLITVSLTAIQMHCGYSQEDIARAIEYLHTSGYIEQRSKGVYVKTPLWDTL